MNRLPTGKVPWDLIAEHVRGALPAGVVLGPGAGEDAALVEIGGETWAVACDPITFTARDAGRLAVTVNANDIAVMGAVPRFFVAAVLLAPDQAREADVERLLVEIRQACERLGVVLIGGHTEVTPGLEHHLVIGTMLGRVLGRPLTTGGLRDGDRVGLSRWAGLEGTAVIYGDHGEKLRELHGPEAFAGLEEVFAGDWLSVVPEALAAAAIEGVHALHDVTEGGVGEALFEMARASGLFIDTDPRQVPVRAETELIAADFGLDPCGLLGSGALLVGCAEEACGSLEAAFGRLGVPLSWLGRARRPGSGEAAGSTLPRFPRDEILKTSRLEGIEALVFDLDGTLVDSHYDWPAIRRRLGIAAPSLIDALNGLDSPERESKWEELRAIERRASAAATLQPGVRELLAWLAGQGFKTALVTNNTADNTNALLERFGLGFDLVMTRDDGLWKPSGAPVAEAIRRLGAEPARTVKVGDSHFDVQAGREAGCGAVVAVHPATPEVARGADLAFDGVEGFLRYLRLVVG